MDGKPTKSIGSEGYRSIDIGPDDCLFAERFAKSKNTIEKIDASTGKSIWSADLAIKSGSFSLGADRIRYSKKDNCIFVMNGQGISKYDISGKPAGDVLDFRDYAILAGGYDVSDMCMDASGNIFVTALSTPANTADRTYKIYKYSVQGDISAVKEQEVITVSVPMSDKKLDMAVGRFQEANPVYKVHVGINASRDKTGNDIDTYIKILNTQILSGKGPDIISVAWLPFKSYASRGILTELGGLMANDKGFDTSKYYSNIFDALKVEGRLYVLPASFSFKVLMANQAVLDKEAVKIDDSRWTWNDFKAIAQKVAGTGNSENLSVLPSFSQYDMLGLFTGGSYNNYVDMDKKYASFSSRGFINLLEMAKDFSSLSGSNIGNDPVSELEAASRGKLIFLPYTFLDYSMYGFVKRAYNNQLGLYKRPTADGSGCMTFSSNSMYSINANARYKEKCWEFLKILLSDEVQMSDMDSGGFSINKAIQRKKAQRVIDGSKSGSTRMTLSAPDGGKMMTFSSAVMTQKDMDYIDKFIEGLKTYAYYDVNINSILQNETKAFFSGTKSAEDTAKLIQDRVSTYLRE